MRMMHPATGQSWSDSNPTFVTQQEPTLSQKIAGWTLKTLIWGRDHVPFGVRSVIGLLFMVGGVLGFLPVLGFWMLPLGLAFIAMDIPFMRHKIEAWMVKLEAKAAGTTEPSKENSDKATNAVETTSDSPEPSASSPTNQNQRPARDKATSD